MLGALQPPGHPRLSHGAGGSLAGALPGGAAVTIFSVEPGGYWPWIARFSNGRPRAQPNRFLNSFSEMLRVNTDGSNDGNDAIALIAPVCGSRTTAAPALAFR